MNTVLNHLLRYKLQPGTQRRVRHRRRLRMERLENRQMMAADLGSLEFVVAAEGEAEEGRSYYVNDEATAGDVYSTAAGSNSSDGLSPAAPMASLGGLLRRYDLEPGDTVFVDTGRYELLKNIDITREDSGVRIVGARLSNKQRQSEQIRCWRTIR